ncbi:MAG: hypothetical protein IPH05_18900 [Flavobacteriales bacterium]|nr:hypothetical protein [Flavobacteriales bacterium]
MVAGYTTIGSQCDFALARCGPNTDGTLDYSFSVDGKVTTDFGRHSDFGMSVTTQPDGKIVVAGYAITAHIRFRFSPV